MAKIHPRVQLQPDDASSCCVSEERERYTVWMKSLVFNSNGFTVYDSHGNLAFRIDNYHSKFSRQVFLMDSKGQVLCTMLKKKLRVIEHWNGYDGERVKSKKPWFQVKRTRRVFNQGSRFSSQVRVKVDECQPSSYMKIQGCVEKSEFQIIGEDESVLAEVKRKEAYLKGIMLGDDVLSLEVMPNVDHSLIMALVVVHCLMSHKIRSFF